jgi:ketosteroid isomerase-like protein
MMKYSRRRLEILFCLLVSVGSTFAVAQPSKEGIEKIKEEWTKSFNSKNLTKLMSLYADDAEIMPPTGERIAGKEKVAAYFKQLFDSATTVDTKVASESTYAAGELGYDSGTYEQTVTRGGTTISGGVTISGNVKIQGGGARSISSGSYLVVLKHKSNNWLIVEQASTQKPQQSTP